MTVSRKVWPHGVNVRRSRCSSRTSNAICASTGSDYEVRTVPVTSSTSQPPPGTSGSSPSSSPCRNHYRPDRGPGRQLVDITSSTSYQTERVSDFFNGIGAKRKVGRPIGHALTYGLTILREIGGSDLGRLAAIGDFRKTTNKRLI